MIINKLTNKINLNFWKMMVRYYNIWINYGTKIRTNNC